MSDPRYATVLREGAHGDTTAGRASSHQARNRTWELRLHTPDRRITVLCGCRLDSPTETIQRALTVLRKGRQP